MFTMWIMFLAFLSFCGTVVGQACPESNRPMVRIAKSRFFIFHNPQTRSNYHSFPQAKKLCESNNMKMAQIRDISTFHYLGRHLEEWVRTTSARDTWYWLDARFDQGKEAYFWGDGTNDPLKYTNFYYRYPRPSGVGSQVDWMDVYRKNSTVEQCLAFALPLPRLDTSQKGAIIYGYSTTFDERPCEGRTKRHAICESTVPECNSKIKDPFYLTEDKNQYFDDGNWIIGERRYIVSWKQRNRNESEDYCSKLGLQMYTPSEEDSALIPHLKIWSRNVTLSQFWTSWSYMVENNSGVFTDPTGNKLITQRSFIKYANPTGRSNKDSMEFCVASQVYYEFRDQLHCAGDNKACTWRGTERVPTNCNNYMGTICQHKNHAKRLVEWNTEYIKSPDLLINDGMKATIEFGWEGNSFTRRSRFKQTFGSLVCPAGFKMIRTNASDSFFTPTQNATLFFYDFLDSYWLVDDEGFKKDTVSKCSLSVPSSEDGRQRKVEMVGCTEWHFYLCTFEKKPIRIPDDRLPFAPPKSPGWNAKRHARVYPIDIMTPNLPDCVSTKARVQMVFVMDRTTTFDEFFDKFPAVAREITKKVGEAYPGSEYGIVHFGDYPTLSEPHESGRAVAASDANCYTLHQKLTSNVEMFLKKTSKPKLIGSGGSEASLLAVMYAAVDFGMGWVTTEADSNGVLVHRVIVLVTDQDYSDTLGKPGNRKPAKGDGTDSCKNNQPPTLKLISEVLQKRSISLIGLFTPTRVHINCNPTCKLGDFAIDIYKRHFSKLMVPTGIFEFSVEHVETISDHILQGIRKNTMCEWADPPAYNTMGL